MKGKYGRNKPYYSKYCPSVETIESQILDLADFTDAENTTGYIDVDTALPAGSIPLGWKIEVLTAFDASATATVQVGVASDANRFSADTSQSVAATGTIGSVALAADACKGMGADQTIRVTVTEDSDFGDFTKGTLKLSLYYIKTS